MKRSLHSQRGQAMAETMGAVLCAIAVVGCVVGAFALAWTGRATGENEVKQILTSAREHAQGGGVTVTFTTGTQSTTVETCGLVINRPCYSWYYSAPEQTLAGPLTFKSSSTRMTWSTITFFIEPDGTAKMYTYPYVCPSDLSLVVGSTAYPVSCKPFAL